MKELEYPFDGNYIIKKKKSIRRQLLSDESVRFTPLKIAILGGETTNDIKNILELFLLNNKIKPEFYESEYNMYYEDAMFPNPELESFAPELIFFCTCNRNISEYPVIEDSKEAVENKLNGTFERFRAMWDQVAEKYRCPIIQNNFEPPFYRLLGNRDSWDIHGRTNFINRLNQLFAEYAASHENFYIHDINYEASVIGLSNWSDTSYWHMYKYGVSVPAIPYFSFNVANIIKSFMGRNKKVLMLDMDNTLWGGVIGDDGADNIEIGQETAMSQVYSEFQSYAKSLKSLGVLLAVNSKNDHDTAIKGLERPDSILHPDDFVNMKINWEPKSRNLVNAASELNLLPESFVFADDNPAEREIIRQEVAGASVPEIGDRPEHYIEILDRSGFFEVTNLSADDLKRNEMYKANAERSAAQASFQNYDDYLKSLEMDGEIQSFIPAYMARIAQLTNKSNQFNLTTKRYTQSEIEAAAGDDSYITLYGKLKDKFGDNGVVSVVIGNVKDDECHIDLWIMSCRVLKRQMENSMMDALYKECSSRGLKKIVGYYYPTAKNNMVREFYAERGFEKISEDPDGNTVWEFDLSKPYTKQNTVICVNGEEN
ncbi:HAD-superfamily phosphatase, subfamily IIIC/FkbH-like domain-containing protein [Lachnospiraceae bacterium]|nr:HAD-superfamily phosphatase, subfamily IIIC/FkbH-like domain-containing protein [Lachnospiraceae bacterium]